MPAGIACRDIALTVGGITVAVKVDGPDGRMVFAGERGVLSKFSSGRPADMALTVRRALRRELPPLSIRENVFTNLSTWSLYRRLDGKALILDSASPDGSFGRMCVMDEDFGKGIIYVVADRIDGQDIDDPISYPLDQILMINFLSKRRGILVHACGLDYHGSGVLFAGDSGAGKTTTATILKEAPGVTTLSDDRIVVRETGGRFFMHGTPWHGTGAFANPAGAELRNIYFLRHGAENAITPMGRTEAASRLFSALFTTFWSKEGADFSLGLCSSIVHNVPCSRFDFLPDDRIIDLIDSDLCSLPVK